MRGISSLHDMAGDWVVSEGGVDKGLSRTLYNMLNSMVLGNVLGTKDSVGDSGVVAGVVVAGHTVGSRDSSIGGHRGHNRVNSRVVDNSRVSISITLGNGVDQTGSIDSAVETIVEAGVVQTIEGAVGSECSQKRGRHSIYS